MTSKTLLDPTHMRTSLTEKFEVGTRRPMKAKKLQGKTRRAAKARFTGTAWEFPYLTLFFLWKGAACWNRSVGKTPRSARCRASPWWSCERRILGFRAFLVWKTSDGLQCLHLLAPSLRNTVSFVFSRATRLTETENINWQRLNFKKFRSKLTSGKILYFATVALLNLFLRKSFRRRDLHQIKSYLRQCSNMKK